MDTKRLRNPDWIDNDGQPLVLDPVTTVEALDQAADEIDRLTANPRRIMIGNVLYQIVFDASNQPLIVYENRVVWSASKGASNAMMSERIRRVLELAKAPD